MHMQIMFRPVYALLASTSLTGHLRPGEKVGGLLGSFAVAVVSFEYVEPVFRKKDNRWASNTLFATAVAVVWIMLITFLAVVWTQAKGGVRSTLTPLDMPPPFNTEQLVWTVNGTTGVNKSCWREVPRVEVDYTTLNKDTLLASRVYVAPGLTRFNVEKGNPAQHSILRPGDWPPSNGVQPAAAAAAAAALEQRVDDSGVAAALLGDSDNGGASSTSLSVPEVVLIGSSIAVSYATMFERLAMAYNKTIGILALIACGGVFDVPVALAEQSAARHATIPGRSGYDGFMSFVYHPEYDAARKKHLSKWKPDVIVWADEWG